MTGRPPDQAEQLRFELPFPAVLPRLANPDLGLRNLSARAGTTDAELTVTLLDAPDHRLMRSGVVLAHRVSEGEGDWYLSLPGWIRGKRSSPPLEQVTPLDGEGELDPDFRTAVQPFLRRSTLGPVAALTVERQDYTLRDAAGTTIGELRDEKVTIRRAGLTTARYREATLSALPDHPLSPARRAWIRESMSLVGATQVDEFPGLVQRIGAPATGPSDFPDPAETDTETTAGTVTALVASGLRALVRGLDTAGRDGQGKVRGGPARDLAAQLAALAPALDPDWYGDVVAGLRAWPAAGPGAAEHRLVVLDRLVAAVRIPPLCAEVEATPRRLFTRLQHDAVERVRDSCGQAHIHGHDAAWDAAAEAVGDAIAVVRLSVDRVPKSRKRLARLVDLHDQLQRCQDPYGTDLRARAASDPDRAFEYGREYERHRQRIERARRTVVDGWDEWAERLGR